MVQLLHAACGDDHSKVMLCKLLPPAASAKLIDHYLSQPESVNMASRLSTSALLIVMALSCLTSPTFGRWSAQETAWLSGLLGAPEEMSPKELESEPVQQAAQFAVKQLNLGSQPGAAAHVLVRVISGTSQVNF